MYTWAELHALYNIHNRQSSNLQPRYNVCPTTTIDTVLGAGRDRALVPMRWGFVPFWHRSPLKEFKVATFNVRIETMTTKPTWRDAWKNKQRCIIPVSGYYEWQDLGKKEKPQPWYFTAADGSPILSVAGLFNDWQDPEANKLRRTCAMIITEPNAFVTEVHDRMPVLLARDQIDGWLSGDAGIEMLRPAPDETLRRVAVSKRVNSSRADDEDATLIDPVGP